MDFKGEQIHHHIIPSKQSQVKMEKLKQTHPLETTKGAVSELKHD